MWLSLLIVPWIFHSERSLLDFNSDLFEQIDLNVLFFDVLLIKFCAWISKNDDNYFFYEFSQNVFDTLFERVSDDLNGYEFYSAFNRFNFYWDSFN